MNNPDCTTDFERLTVQRFVPASPERVFEAWTNADELKHWWGPKGVTCVSAEVDLRVGGSYRIANELPDGSILWISGEFEIIERPRLLVYTWVVENANPETERVSVEFTPHERGTNVVVRHERIATAALNKQHQQGWNGCLDGLVEYLDEA